MYTLPNFLNGIKITNDKIDVRPYAFIFSVASFVFFSFTFYVAHFVNVTFFEVDFNKVIKVHYDFKINVILNHYFIFLIAVYY